MSKGSHRRPSSVPTDQVKDNYEDIFGAKPPNIMSNKDRASVGLPSDGEQPPTAPTIPVPCRSCASSDTYVDGGRVFCNECLHNGPFWIGPGYRGEYSCPHGVGHGNHVHGCCGYQCCSRPDFPLRRNK